MKVMFVDLVVDEVDIGINVYNFGNVCFFVCFDIYEWEEVLVNLDYLIIYVFFKGGKVIIGVEEIVQMKNGVVFINIVCGGVIDEDVLFDVFNSGKLSGVGFDVYENEFMFWQELMEYFKVFCFFYIGVFILEV